MTVMGTTVLGSTVAAALLALAVAGASPVAPAAAGTPPAALAAGAAAGGAVTTAAGVRAPRCTPGDLSASLALSVQGTTLAGAVLLSDTGQRACALSGTPSVTVAATGGGGVDVVEQRTTVRRAEPVVLAAGGHGGRGAQAGVSVTWSEWRCTPGSFSLDVRFPGWSRPVVAPYGTPADDGGAACTSSGLQTLYVGPVTRLRG